MAFDHHYKTIEEAEEFVNGTIENLLPGFIRRHRQEIILAVRQEAKYLFDSEEQAKVIWGATKALDELARVRPTPPPETRQGEP